MPVVQPDGLANGDCPGSLRPVIPERLLPVLERTSPLAERFAASGYKLYLVGGVVRDLLLGRDMSNGRDIDLTTDALPAETKRLVNGWADSVWSQGERFGTIGCQKDGWTFEITTHRAEAYDPESRKPEVVFSDVIDAVPAPYQWSPHSFTRALRVPESEPPRYDITREELETNLRGDPRHPGPFLLD